MLVNVKGKNLEVTDALRSYIEKKLQKLEKYFQNIREATVSLTVVRGLHQVEVQLEGDGVVLRGEERRGTDMYGSIDQVIDKLEIRVKKFKGRHYAKSTEAGPREKEAIRSKAIADSIPTEVEDMPGIVRIKKFALKAMTPDEATEHMELLHHSFYLFINSDTDIINVVYKREDGNYGLIEPV